ncbi:hypothetical protein JOC31_000683 [Streptococcus saliviloxodontae]|uniref:Uncharacterized protein n=1 Tax=Streptococcus saliviloxodontae TaxID=1349416 RepID=A0ABS2PKB2_9STRE|nr:hypothetical protein [Streptococcus saliviloxodontae]
MAFLWYNETIENVTRRTAKLVREIKWYAYLTKGDEVY